MLLNDVKVREAEFVTNKGGEPIVIGQITDIHLNYITKNDLNDPELKNTYDHRPFCAGMASVPNLVSSLEYCKNFDYLCLTGDVLDFCSEGTMELAKKYIFGPYKNVLACIGSHDITKNVQTNMRDKLTYEQRIDRLRPFWSNDFEYASVVLGNKVMLITMNDEDILTENGPREVFNESQYQKLYADIEKARKEDLLVLLFVHVPIFTGEYNRVFERDCKQMPIVLACEKNPSPTTKKTYDLIVSSADVIRGVFSGHFHTDFETEIEAGYEKDGKFVKQNIREYCLNANAYGAEGHVMKITVK